jgi:virginiamycin A acetyltransferase
VHREYLKKLLNGIALALATPLALLTGFGKIRPVFTTLAHFCALIPGLPGDYMRIAFYRLTLAECSLHSRISFGSFFAHPDGRCAPGVYIGSYCILGRVTIGRGSQIASAVQILSGKQQHKRDEQGRISGAEQGTFETVRIGEHCWIGAGAIVMADVGPRSTIGAGSVVTREIPADSTAVGSPARVIGSTETGSTASHRAG